LLTGMTSAAFAIIWMKIQLEWHSIIFCSFGAIFGLVFGKLQKHIFLLLITHCFELIWPFFVCHHFGNFMLVVNRFIIKS
jgi:hypothetical protein